MIVQELWSQSDEARLSALSAAVARGDLTRALQAIEDATPEQAEVEQSLLGDLGERVASRLASREPSPTEQAQVLAAVLGDELGFRGDTDGYKAPCNSHLREVLQRRRGLPILLSIVWIEVGRRAGLVMDGIGMPAHFLARVGGDRGVYVDPFSGGTLLAVADCERLHREISGGAAWSGAYLRPSPTAKILERVLKNLMNAYGQEDDGAALFKTVSMICTLRPDTALPHLQRAEVARLVGATGLAIEGFRDVVARFPGTKEAAIAETCLRKAKPALLQ